MIDHVRLIESERQVRRELLAARDGNHWVGQLASSALSTATAISALSIVQRQHRWDGDSGEHDDSLLSELIVQGLQWLSKQQNEDGGWGDTDQSYSNISTTMLALSAFRLTGVPADTNGLLDRAEKYIEKQGGIRGLRQRYGRDKTFAVPILTNAALAGIVPWRKVSSLPFELAVFPQSFYRFLQMPVVSYAVPALVAIGQARFFNAKPWNPVTRLIRSLSVAPTLRVLSQMQPASGGFLEAIPLTSFVVMSLAATGRADHSVVKQGVRFLLSSVRDDGSWPIDTNLATWNTSLALNAIGAESLQSDELDSCIDWLLSCQQKEVHPYTGAEPGGWGWSDLSGAVPDADDTPGALLALKQVVDHPEISQARRSQVTAAARNGIQWLLDLQNRDGGWPTFCRGWGKLPFDRSGSDLTAHCLRALQAWSHLIEPSERDQAVRRGFNYLQRTQRPEGTWVPLWFGNQDHPEEENPVYGSAKVLLGLHAYGKSQEPMAQRGLQALVALQNLDGGWGGGPRHVDEGESKISSSIEETALALEALLPCVHTDQNVKTAVFNGLEWLLSEVEHQRHRDVSPIGFYFAKLWYYEELYPLTFTASALAAAVRMLGSPDDQKLTAAQLST